MLEWVAYAFSRDLLDLGTEPDSPALQVDSLPAELPGKPNASICGLIVFLFASIVHMEFSKYWADPGEFC